MDVDRVFSFLAVLRSNLRPEKSFSIFGSDLVRKWQKNFDQVDPRFFRKFPVVTLDFCRFLRAPEVGWLVGVVPHSGGQKVGWLVGVAPHSGGHGLQPSKSAEPCV